ncbi:heme-binding protein 2-like [Panulirus ornatus]|uniref:heme-binding protein 2-like n=1 Tax=Panulirus ornatus TaxID=150431 RepID=UPI003A8A5353
MVTNVFFLLFLAITGALASTDFDFSDDDSEDSYFEKHEMAPYTVIKNAETYQVRVYPPTKWACAQTNKSEDKKEGMRMFMALFDYIDGMNDMEMEINMTVPVSMRKDKKGADGTKWCQMCFYIPSALQETTPQPQGDRVFIQERPRMMFATRTFGGYMMRMKQWKAEKVILQEDLKMAEEPGVDFSSTYWAVYDPPMKTTNRRNEVWFPMKE